MSCERKRGDMSEKKLKGRDNIYITCIFIKWREICCFLFKRNSNNLQLYNTKFQLYRNIFELIVKFVNYTIYVSTKVLYTTLFITIMA